MMTNPTLTKGDIAEHVHDVICFGLDKDLFLERYRNLSNLGSKKHTDLVGHLVFNQHNMVQQFKKVFINTFGG